MLRVIEHELCVEPEHPIAEPSERAIPVGVRRKAPCVICAVNFDDKPCALRDEIRDVAPANNDLPAKPSACLAPLREEPKSRFARSERAAVLCGEELESV